MIKRYVIIDDDKLNNILCTHIIKAVVNDADVSSHSKPEEALAHIHTTASESNLPMVILLDINMPTLTGWEVLERIAAMPEAVRKCFHVYMLSSSVNQRDKERAGSNALVSGYIEKPLDPLKVPLIDRL